MKILFVSAEVSPYAKVGGLADVAGSLPKALAAHGHDVRIVMPAYGMTLSDPRWKVRRVGQLEAVMNSAWSEKARIHEVVDAPVPVYLVGSDKRFADVDRSERIYGPNGSEPYQFFSCAALALPEAIGWEPDVIHCHDWQTGFVPVLMRERKPDRWAAVAAVYTVHNLAYQGEFPPSDLDLLGLPRSLFDFRHVEAYGAVNYLKAGCTYADHVTTVSPRYAEEIQTPGYGCRLDGLMRFLDEQGRLSGILNGLDLDEFNPATDPHIAANYSAANPAGKAACRAELLANVGLRPIQGAPIIGIVTRLSEQKGMDLVLAAGAELARKAQLIVLGTGDPALGAGFLALQAKNRTRVRFLEGFSIDMAPKIYAGSDLFLMPSAFEPCGLGQMIAMRYGTPPIVRRTGGLSNTVFEGENGFVFDLKTPEAMMAAVNRAVKAFKDPERWTKLMHAGMTGAYGWDGRASAYERVYERCAAARQAPVRVRA